MECGIVGLRYWESALADTANRKPARKKKKAMKLDITIYVKTKELAREVAIRLNGWSQPYEPGCVGVHVTVPADSPAIGEIVDELEELGNRVTEFKVDLPHTWNGPHARNLGAAAAAALEFTAKAVSLRERRDELRSELRACEQERARAMAECVQAEERLERVKKAMEEISSIT